MTGEGDPREAGGQPVRRPTTLVWIDERAAIIARWNDGRANLERIESEVPSRHRSTGHVRHEPGIRHGGGGAPQTAGEPHRLEHLTRFVEEVAGKVPAGDDVLIIGPGMVRDHLHRRVLESSPSRQVREVETEAAPRLSDRQLLARLRGLAGAEAPRARAGAYRWSVERSGQAGQASAIPRRVARKPHPEETGEVEE